VPIEQQQIKINS
jgi:hypothetical protein